MAIKSVLFAVFFFTFSSASFLEDAEVASESHSRGPRPGRSARLSGNSFRYANDPYHRGNVPPRNALHKVLLDDYPEAKCNDGSPAGYYIRRSLYGSKVWFIYFEGGWFCFDQESCHWRMQNYNQYTSSKKWESYINGAGILSGDSEENPLFYVHNFVYVFQIPLYSQ